MQVIGIKTLVFKEKESLVDFITMNLPSLNEGDILVITSKIIALSEGRVGKIEDKDKLILKESKKIIQTPWAYLTLTNEGWGINAGLDESNAENKLILLPKDPFKTTELLLKILKKHYSIKKLGIIITDTRTIPLRVGTIGRAIGFAGFEPLRSYIGKKDLFGRKSRVTQSNLADALAASAVLVMGEGNEQIPIVVIKQTPVKWTSKPLLKKQKQLAFPAEKDIFSKVFISTERGPHKPR